MPSSHRRYADWTLPRIMREAAEIGPNTTALVEIILREKQRFNHAPGRGAADALARMHYQPCFRLPLSSVYRMRHSGCWSVCEAMLVAELERLEETTWVSQPKPVAAQPAS